MATFVLVHGAWHGAWCWHKVEAEFCKLGHRVIVPDLPSHAIDRTPVEEVTLDSYAQCIVDILENSSEPVTLVGHSMGGFVITQAAERKPNKVATLVYLAAALAENGTSLHDFTQMSQTDAGGMQGVLVINESQSSMTINPAVIKEKFYADCSDADVVLAKMLLTPQSLLPFQNVQISSTERWGKIPRHYIECLQDQALSLEIQRYCQEKLPCQSVKSMDTSHSPFFSAPELLVEYLVSL